MTHRINPETDPIAACLLIFARRGAAIRAERERLQVTEQPARVQISPDEPSVIAQEVESQEATQPS
jgi:hypothetical protein